MTDRDARNEAQRFEYLLNAMENAAARDTPAKHGYADKRKAVLAYVQKLEESRQAAYAAGAADAANIAESNERYPVVGRIIAEAIRARQERGKEKP